MKKAQPGLCPTHGAHTGLYCPRCLDDAIAADSDLITELTPEQQREADAYARKYEKRVKAERSARTN